MANESRGEVEVRLDGKAYTMRPTFQALADIESRTGMSIGELLQRLTEGKFGVTHVTIVIHAGLRAFDERAPSFEEVGEMIVGQGLASVIGAAAGFLAGAIASLAPRKSRARKA